MYSIITSRWSAGLQKMKWTHYIRWFSYLASSSHKGLKAECKTDIAHPKASIAQFGDKPQWAAAPYDNAYR